MGAIKGLLMLMHDWTCVGHFLIVLYRHRRQSGRNAGVLVNALLSYWLPVCLVQKDDFVAAGRKGDLLLSEHLYLIAHNVDASVQGGAKGAKDCSQGAVMQVLS
eukprot:1183770-Prorocentrum_minimum.AAC.2